MMLAEGARILEQIDVGLTKYQVWLTCGKHKKYDLSVKSYPDIECNTRTEEQHELVANYLEWILRTF